jgi:LasA protease
MLFTPGATAETTAETTAGTKAEAQAAAWPAFGLPAAPGQNIGSAGIHSDDGSSGVKNAIDLNPRDDIVRAPLAGTAHLQQCSAGAWVTIDHVDGWRTGYYHMENVAVTDGQQVQAGTVLGNVGNAVPCGGSSSGAHVHFTLWRLNAARSAEAAGDWDGITYERLETTVAAEVGESVSGHTFGGWTFQEGDVQYAGTATKVATGQVVRLPGTFRYDG